MNDQLAKIRRLRAMQYRREQNVMSDLDIYAIFTMYNNNIEMSGQIFLEKQT